MIMGYKLFRLVPADIKVTCSHDGAEEYNGDARCTSAQTMDPTPVSRFARTPTQQPTTRTRNTHAKHHGSPSVALQFTPECPLWASHTGKCVHYINK